MRDTKADRTTTNAEHTFTKTDDSHTACDYENQAPEQQAGYPDISKANTKTVVIISFVCILVLFLLSILVPDAAGTDSSTEQPESTEVTIEETQPGFTSCENETYYYAEDNAPVTGWLMINDTSYLFREDGTMVTGWYVTEGHLYYFDEDGALLTNQWVDNKYVGEDGYALKDTFTPDGGYVDADGNRDTTVSLERSIEGLSELKTTLEDMLEGYSGTWSVYVKNLNTNEYMVINNVQHFSASLIKLYCAATVYELIDQGTLEETENIDSLLSQMISISDNDAFNLLVMDCAENHSHITGRGVIQDYIDENGYVDTTITSILVPTRYKAPSSPGRNYTTVVDCGLLLEKIYKKQCVSPEASDAFLELLLNQSHVSKIPAGLPEGTKCANKTGDTDEVQHDAAIVYAPNGTYIICVMSSNCGAAVTNIQSISKTVYDYFNAKTAVTTVSH